jgi:voltage-gated potassium channel Kch
MKPSQLDDKTKFRLLGVAVALLLVVGTMFYHWHEQLSWVDSLYLSAVTLATVGYGDVHPVTDLGKLFTVLYIFSGVGVIVAFTQALVHRAGLRREDRDRNRGPRK